MRSVTESGKFDNEKCNEKTAKKEKYEDEITRVGGLENVIKTKKRNITCMTYRQGHMLKWLKEKENFLEMITNFGVRKSTIIFKINNLRLINKYPKLRNLSISIFL